MHRIAKIFKDDDESEEEEIKISKANNTAPIKETIQSFTMKN